MIEFGFEQLLNSSGLYQILHDSLYPFHTCYPFPKSPLRQSQPLFLKVVNVRETQPIQSSKELVPACIASKVIYQKTALSDVPYVIL